MLKTTTSKLHRPEPEAAAGRLEGATAGGGPQNSSFSSIQNTNKVRNRRKAAPPPAGHSDVRPLRGGAGRGSTRSSCYVSS